MPDLGWTRTVDGDENDPPGWDLDADPSYYVEKWGPGSYAAWHGDVRIGEPGSYGTRGEAMEAAEAAYRKDTR